MVDPMERQRRRVLWALSALHPGDLGQSCEHLLALITTSIHPSGHEIVDGQSIPSPWRERFAQASIGSTRLAAGPYLSDPQKFVDDWEAEMIHLRDHQNAMKPC